MNWIKCVLAKCLKRRMMVHSSMGKAQADKWNHLSAIIATKGKVRLDWNKIRGIPVIKCSRCIKVIRRGEGEKELCDGCKKK